MINDLFDIFPESIAFKILTYQPHKTADMISIYWMKKLHKKRYDKVMKNINDMNNDMIEWMTQEGIEDTFYESYMYFESPRRDENLELLSIRSNNNMDWYLV